MKPGHFKLIGLDIEGEWNRPLLINAAALSGGELLLAATEAQIPAPGPGEATEVVSLEQALEGCRQVLACETTHRSVSVYDWPAPRGTAAVLVGNEERGISRPVLKRADQVISIPMVSSGLSSVNVAVAAAITLYVLAKDLARKPRPKSRLRHADVDLLIEAPNDPHELGSLLRSAYAFGWRRVFVSDPHRVWFVEDPKVILESRAAARRSKNPVTVLPAEQLDRSLYDAVLACDGTRQGTPLSKLKLPDCQRLLVVFGRCELPCDGRLPGSQVYVDFENRNVEPRFRHTGSVLFSIVSQMLSA